MTHISIWNSFPGFAPHNRLLHRFSKDLLLPHNIITVNSVCQLWLFLIRSRPQRTERAEVQLQSVVAWLRPWRRWGLCAGWSCRPGSIHTQGTEGIKTDPSGCVSWPDVVRTKTKATWLSRHSPRGRQLFLQQMNSKYSNSWINTVEDIYLLFTVWNMQCTESSCYSVKHRQYLKHTANICKLLTTVSDLGWWAIM